VREPLDKYDGLVPSFRAASLTIGGGCRMSPAHGHIGSLPATELARPGAPLDLTVSGM